MRVYGESAVRSDVRLSSNGVGSGLTGGAVIPFALGIGASGSAAV